MFGEGDLFGADGSLPANYGNGRAHDGASGMLFGPDYTLDRPGQTVHPGPVVSPFSSRPGFTHTAQAGIPSPNWQRPSVPPAPWLDPGRSQGRATARTPWGTAGTGAWVLGAGGYRYQQQPDGSYLIASPAGTTTGAAVGTSAWTAINTELQAAGGGRRRHAPVKKQGVDVNRLVESGVDVLDIVASSGKKKKGKRHAPAQYQPSELAPAPEPESSGVPTWVWVAGAAIVLLGVGAAVLTAGGSGKK